MDNSEVKRRAILAIEKFLEQDAYLLKVNASERSITHRLGVYLEEQFHLGWHIDCEYNKIGLDSKMIYVYEVKSGKKLKKRRRVFPDIIVHKRDTGNNLLVIEVKKGKRSRESEDFDKFKLQCYRNQSNLSYSAALFLKFTTGANPQAVIEWV